MKSILNVLATAAVLGCGLFLSMQTASATPVNGTEVLGGTFTIGPTFLNFCAAPGPCAAAPGPWNAPATGTGDLINYTGNGLITNLSSGVEPIGTLLPGHGIPFVVFTPGAAVGGGSNPTPVTIEFFISEVFAGVGDPTCSSLTCTPPGSPVTFLNTSGGGSSATVSATGFAENLTTGEFDPLNIIFTSQFNVPYSTVLFAESQVGGSITNTYSASFSASSIPEPSTMQMMGAGIGLVLFAVARRRKQTR
jgi:hypothetical protein